MVARTVGLIGVGLVANCQLNIDKAIDLRPDVRQILEKQGDIIVAVELGIAARA